MTSRRVMVSPAARHAPLHPYRVGVARFESPSTCVPVLARGGFPTCVLEVTGNGPVYCSVRLFGSNDGESWQEFGAMEACGDVPPQELQVCQRWAFWRVTCDHLTPAAEASVSMVLS